MWRDTLMRVTTTRWLSGLWSTQTKVEGIVLKAAWHWGSDSVLTVPVGNQTAPHCVGLPSALYSVDGGRMFSAFSGEGAR